MRQPDPPTALDISSCTVNLMPWSAFPCAFDADQYAGLPGQASDLCYTNNSEVDAALGPSALARNLTTDGYINLFYGVLPQQLCHGIEVPQVESLLLNVDFRLATGRQFDRTYSFQIGHAVVSMNDKQRLKKVAQHREIVSLPYSFPASDHLHLVLLAAIRRYTCVCNCQAPCVGCAGQHSCVVLLTHLHLESSRANCYTHLRA